MEVVGSIKFQTYILPIYRSLDDPLFRASDVANLMDYGTIQNVLRFCEEDEKLSSTLVMAGQERQVYFVTETGLYNILAQSRKPLARAWRRVIFQELVALRRNRDKNISEQFKDWDHQADDIYFDDEQNMLMRSVTLPGGDVEQVPVFPG